MRGLLVAVSFLTRIPVRVVVTDAGQLGTSVPFFPVVGALVGSMVGLVLVAGMTVWPPMVAAAVAVGVGLLLTGAFHEDGLADTFDSVGAGSDRDRAFRIMKDSRLGTYGSAALIVAILVRVGSLAALGASPIPALVAVNALSRGVAAAAMGFARPAAVEGLGASYLEGLGRTRPLVALMVGVAIAVIGLGWDQAWPVVMVSTAVGAVLVVRSVRRLGGITGDVLGATQQVAELSGLLVILA